MRCTKCDAAEVTERRENTCARLLPLLSCAAPVASSSMSEVAAYLNWTQYPSDVIALVVFWRLRYKLSLRDLPEMFLIRGIEFSYEAVRDWEEKLTPSMFDSPAAAAKKRIGRSWYVDETDKYQGPGPMALSLPRHRSEWRSGRREIQRDTRHGGVAKAFFDQPKTVTGVSPARVTTDKHDSYPRAIRTELGKGVEHRTNRYLNIRIEHDHRGVCAADTDRCAALKVPTPPPASARGFDELRNHLYPRSRRGQNIPDQLTPATFSPAWVIALRIMEVCCSPARNEPIQTYLLERSLRNRSSSSGTGGCWTYSVAVSFWARAPIAVVVAGILIGNNGLKA